VVRNEEGIAPDICAVCHPWLPFAPLAGRAELIFRKRKPGTGASVHHANSCACTCTHGLLLAAMIYSHPPSFPIPCRHAPRWARRALLDPTSINTNSSVQHRRKSRWVWCQMYEAHYLCSQSSRQRRAMWKGGGSGRSGDVRRQPGLGARSTDGNFRLSDHQIIYCLTSPGNPCRTLPRMDVGP